jgi:hypothetical protein
MSRRLVGDELVLALARPSPPSSIAAERGMSAFSSLDREAFQQLLASAFAVQESQIDTQSLSAVMEVQRLLRTRELDVDGAMHRIVESARKVANATGVAIALLKGDRLVYRAGSGSAGSYVGRQVTASLTVPADTNRGRAILRVEDAQTDTRIEGAICREFGGHSLLILAIYQARALAGVLEVLFSEAHTFHEREVRTYELMARQIEAAIFQAAPLEQKTNPIAHSPIIPKAGAQVAHQVETFLNDSGSLPGPPPKQSIRQKRGATWATVKELPLRNQPSWFAMKIRQHAKDFKWLGRQQNLALAAVSTALILIWIAYVGGRPVSPLGSSARPTSTVVDQQVRSKADKLPSKTAAVLQPAPVSVNAARPPRPRVRRIRVGNNEVDYVGEDVTVRYFTYPSPPQSRLTADGRVAYIGDDVTVRYFTPQPAVRPDGR